MKERSAHKQITLTEKTEILDLADGLSPHLWIGAFLLVRPHQSVPANELRIAVQTIGDEIDDDFLGYLIHKAPHRVIPIEQTCRSISNVLQFRALED